MRHNNVGIPNKENADIGNEFEENDFCESGIRRYLRTKWAGHTIHMYDVIGSTNREAKNVGLQKETSLDHGSFFVADVQENGRGRRGRDWIAPAGTNIACSILLRPSFTPEIALVMALSVTEALEHVLGIHQCSELTSGTTSDREQGINPCPEAASDSKRELKLGIKWPNDIVLCGKKIVGILTEMGITSDGDAANSKIQYVVIGTGINVNNTVFPEEIETTATSLFLKTGKKWSRAQIMAELLTCFEKNYERFEKEQDLAWMQDSYQKRLVNYQSSVKVLDPAGEFTGIAKGINSLGELVVEKSTGETVNVYAGEVSVRGIYGYV